MPIRSLVLLPLAVALGVLPAMPVRAQTACPTTCAAFVDPPPGGYTAFTSVTASVVDGGAYASCATPDLTGSHVAACINGTLRDVATAARVSGQFRYSLTLGGALADDEDAITFRYCGQGDTTPVDLTPRGNADNTPTFHPNRTYGTFSIPYRLASDAPLFPTTTSSQTTRQSGGGWRQVAAPLACATLDSVFGFTWTQGFPGSDAPQGPITVYRYDEAAAGALNAGFRRPISQAETMPRGVGYFVYLFEDNVYGGDLDGGFPKTVSTTGPEIPASEGFTFAVTYTDGGTGDRSANDGWNLLGNPFPETLAWNAVQRSGVAQTVYVYDPEIADYRLYNGSTGDLDGGLIAPWQGFWVQATAAGPSLVAPAASRGTGGVFFGRTAATRAIELHVAGAIDGREREAAAFVSFEDGALEERDPADGASLDPLDDRWLTLATATPDGTRLKLNAVPARPSRTLSFPIVPRTSAASATALTLTWPRLDLPDGLAAELLDTATGERIDLRDATSYAFTAEPDGTGRLTLLVGPEGAVGAEPEADLDAFTLSEVAPNPVGRSAALRLTVGAPQRVEAALYDVLGRRLRTLFDGPARPGEPLRLAVEAEGLAPGAYVIRIAGERFADARPFTVVR